MAGGKRFYFKQLQETGIWNWYDLWGKDGKLISFSEWPWGSSFTISKLEFCGYRSTQEVKTDGYNRGIKKFFKDDQIQRVTHFLIH